MISDEQEEDKEDWFLKWVFSNLGLEREREEESLREEERNGNRREKGKEERKVRDKFVF